MDDTEFIERKIITGMIVSDEFLREINRIPFDTNLLLASPARTIARWCLDYYSKFSRAPGPADFESMFQTNMKGVSKSEVTDLEELLESISSEYEKDPPTTAWLLATTDEYLRIRSVTVLGEKLLTSASKKGGLEDAEGALSEYLSAESKRTKSNAVDVFSAEAVRRAFKAMPKPLIRFGKALDEFWGGQFVRDSFVGFLAPEKRGKSWWLQEIGVRGTTAGLNGAIFQAGDMSESQAATRLYMRTSGLPAPYRSSIQYEEEDYEIEGTGPTYYWEPRLDCTLNQIGECPYRSTHQENPSQEPLFSGVDSYKEQKSKGTLAEAVRMESLKRDCKWDVCHNCSDKFQPTVFFRKKVVRRVLDEREARRGINRWTRHSKGRLFLATYPNETLSVSQIQSRLDEWEKVENLKIDVVVIDYADILAPDSDYGKLDARNQINKTWQRLRSMSEKRHCLVVTATQAAATAYDRGLLRLSDFSEDKRKMAHVTAMYGLNQTSQEKRMGIMRINPIVIREGDYDQSRCVSVLQCLSIGRPMITSFITKAEDRE